MLQNDSSMTRSRESSRSGASVSLRCWLVWLFLVGLVPVLFVLSKDNTDTSSVVTRQKLIGSKV